VCGYCYCTVLFYNGTLLLYCIVLQWHLVIVLYYFIMTINGTLLFAFWNLVTSVYKSFACAHVSS
jgi:hypothetical protein